MSKGGQRTTGRDGSCVGLSRLPVEIGPQLPRGLEKQFLSDSCRVKKKDPFVNNI